MADSLDIQRAETFAIFSDIAAENELPDMAVVDFQFIPLGENPSWSAIAAELNSLGFPWKRYSDDSTLEISTRPLALGAETIWEHEKLFTELVEGYGFTPDGWGFYGVNTDGDG